MGLQKFQKNILKATHNLEFSAVSVFPDSSITLDTRMSNLDIRMSKLDIRVSIPTILVLKKDISFSILQPRVRFLNQQRYKYFCAELILKADLVLCKFTKFEAPKLGKTFQQSNSVPSYFQIYRNNICISSLIGNKGDKTVPNLIN